jgi:hypothetical protein
MKGIRFFVGREAGLIRYSLQLTEMPNLQINASGM